VSPKFCRHSGHPCPHGLFANLARQGRSVSSRHMNLFLIHFLNVSLPLLSWNILIFFLVANTRQNANNKFDLYFRIGIYMAYSSSHKYVPIGYKYISGIRTNHFDNFVNVLGEVKRKN
jgi:hypothetical protein